MSRSRKVHEISDSDDDDAEPMLNALKKSKKNDSPKLPSPRDSVVKALSPKSPKNNVKKRADPVPPLKVSPGTGHSVKPSSSSANLNRTTQTVNSSSSISTYPLSKSSSFPLPSKSPKTNGLRGYLDLVKEPLEDTPSGLPQNHLSPLSEEEATSRLSLGRDEAIAGSGAVPCQYGFTCYRTNPDHLKEHSHESRRRGFYLTKCDGIQSKFNADTFTRSLKQILHEDVGDQLESAVHFSYIYDAEWLLEQYPREWQQLPMLLVVQQSNDLLQLLIAQRQVFRNVSLLPIELARFGTHHSKMISLKFKNHLRFVVTTANLYGPDWGRKSQMVWVSPMLKKSSTPKKGPDSATGFRSAICTYLRSYQKKKLLDLAESYADYDFSPIERCYFIGSSPNSINSGLMTVDQILSKNVPPLSNKNPITFCFSSIGTLGQDDSVWLKPTFGRAVMANDSSNDKQTSVNDISFDNVQMLYPTIDEVRKSLEGYEAGRSLPYSGRVHSRQRWLTQWLHRWKADRVGRSRAAPHVKFYIRTSADYQQTFWFLMSSANLSKAAWGSMRTKPPLSYECGVLYIPDRPLSTEHVVVPFDLPPQRYSSTDRLWIQDNVYQEPDDNGNSWDPRQGGAVSVV